AANVTVTGNNAWRNGGGMSIGPSTNVTIEGNNVWKNGDGIDLRAAEDVILKDNNVTSSRWFGIGLYFSVNVTVKGNTLINDGILLWGNVRSEFNSHTITTDNLVNNLPVYYYKNCEDLVVDSVPLGQLLIVNCSNVRVANLTITKADVAVNMAFVNGAHVAGNNFSSNSKYGLLLWYSTNVTFVGNHFSSNYYGMYLLDSVSVFVHHNNFVDNLIEAYDILGNENSWDNGYPSGGNYWSIYEGIDRCSGPNQDVCPDRDGIGDTPYLLDADSRDNYPLMLPFGMTHPRPPEMLKATLIGRNLENVTLSWSPSPDDGMGFDIVVGYEIYRNTTYHHNGEGYKLITSLPNGTSVFIDSLSGEGNPSNYYYQVRAVDVYNNTTYARGQAGKFTRPLSQGPNLISIPLIQSNESIEYVLQTLSFDRVWIYDSLSKEWKSFMKFKSYKALEQINHTMGVWINVTEESNLTVAGVVPAQTTIHLHVGWNLVGFPSFDSAYTVSDLKATVGSTRVEGFDTQPPHYLRVLVEAEILQAAYGYWIKVEADMVWTIDDH
ncbi:MAG: NosD domain-containing protein, partial [Thermoplasmata archaeon]